MTRQPPEPKPFRTQSGWRTYLILAVIVVLIVVGLVTWIGSL